MNRQRILGFVAGLIVIVAAVVFLLPSKAPLIHVVTSDDGTAELRVPLKALPAGVTPESISVKRVAVEAEGVLARYELLPSGLQFSEPATLLVHVPFPEQPSDESLRIEVPTVVLQNGGGGGGERLATSFVPDHDRSVTEVTAQVEHFSAVTVLSFLDARIDDIGDVIVGSPVPTGVRITRVRAEVRVPVQNDPNAVAYVFADGGWTLSNGRMISRTAAVAPDIKRDLPKDTVPAAGGDGRPFYGALRYFTCVEMGDARMAYVAYSYMDMKVFAVDAQDRRSPVDFDTDGSDTDVRLETPKFRCLAAAEEVKEEVLIDPGEGDGIRTAEIRAAKGVWEATVTPSKRSALVGESFNVDVEIVDVSDRLLATLPEADRAKYRTPWEVEGNWHVVEGIYDRAPIVPAPKREAPYGGKLTYRLPVRCEQRGVGAILLEASIGRVLQPTPSIVPGLPARVEVRLPAVYVECVGPTEAPPKVEPDRIKVSPSTLQQTHRVGTSPCPQKMGTLKIDGPANGLWTATGIPDWMNMPDSGAFGDVDVFFNCEIDDTSAHDEKATITIKSGNVETNVGVGVHIRD